MVILLRMKTAISLPDELFERIERRAAELGLSRSEFFQQAARAFLEQQRDDDVSAALDAVFGDDPERGRLDELLGQMQWISVGRDEWE